MTIFSLICLSVFSTTATAQQVGEAYVKDGIPCVIIDVDESGTRGLVMTLLPKSKVYSAAEKELKKTGKTDAWFYVEKKETKEEKANRYTHVLDFFNQTKVGMSTGFGGNVDGHTTTSLSGKENMQNVINYCKEKGISMEEYFPTFAWAKNLGEGWYIPGVNEFKLYIKLFAPEKMKEVYTFGWSFRVFSVQFLANRNKLVSNFKNSIDLLPESASLFKDMRDIAAYSITSSTIAAKGLIKEKDDECEYTCLTTETQGTNLAETKWFKMGYGETNVCAVCEVQF